jgi:hypothetical protein
MIRAGGWKIRLPAVWKRDSKPTAITNQYTAVVDTLFLQGVPVHVPRHAVVEDHSGV